MPGMLMSERISTMSATPRCSSSCRAPSADKAKNNSICPALTSRRNFCSNSARTSSSSSTMTTFMPSLLSVSRSLRQTAAAE